MKVLVIPEDPTVDQYILKPIVERMFVEREEYWALLEALNAYEKANPTITTQTTNYMGDTVTGQTSTTKGGVKEGARQLMAVEDVKADPEYGAYQAATTYFDAMMDMIGG